MFLRIPPLASGLIALLAIAVASPSVTAQDVTVLERDSIAAVEKLFETTPAAKDLAGIAKGILVFPNIVKAGFLVGGQYGTGSLLKGNPEDGYYATDFFNIAAASYGLQAGAQSFGYALILVTDRAIRKVETSWGFELGAGPHIVVVDAGVAKTLSTKTVDSDVYAFTFGQKGLMGGLGLQGTKVTKLER